MITYIYSNSLRATCAVTYKESSRLPSKNDIFQIWLKIAFQVKFHVHFIFPVLLYFKFPVKILNKFQISMHILHFYVNSVCIQLVQETKVLRNRQEQ